MQEVNNMLNFQEMTLLIDIVKEKLEDTRLDNRTQRILTNILLTLQNEQNHE